MNKGLNNLTLPRAASEAKIRGSLPPPSPPPVRRHDAPCEAGGRRAGAARRFTPEEAAIRARRPPMRTSR